MNAPWPLQLSIEGRRSINLVTLIAPDLALEISGANELLSEERWWSVQKVASALGTFRQRNEALLSEDSLGIANQTIN